MLTDERPEQLAALQPFYLQTLMAVSLRHIMRARLKRTLGSDPNVAAGIGTDGLTTWGPDESAGSSSSRRDESRNLRRFEAWAPQLDPSYARWAADNMWWDIQTSRRSLRSGLPVHPPLCEAHAPVSSLACASADLDSPIRFGMKPHEPVTLNRGVRSGQLPSNYIAQVACSEFVYAHVPADCDAITWEQGPRLGKQLAQLNASVLLAVVEGVLRAHWEEHIKERPAVAPGLPRFKPTPTPTEVQQEAEKVACWLLQDPPVVARLWQVAQAELKSLVRTLAKAAPAMDAAGEPEIPMRTALNAAAVAARFVDPQLRLGATGPGGLLHGVCDFADDAPAEQAALEAYHWIRLQLLEAPPVADFLLELRFTPRVPYKNKWFAASGKALKELVLQLLAGLLDGRPLLGGERQFKEEVKPHIELLRVLGMFAGVRGAVLQEAVEEWKQRRAEAPAGHVTDDSGSLDWMPPHVSSTTLSWQPLGCWNAACVNLDNCSEACLKLKTCSSCGAARYCSTECQKSDFKLRRKKTCVLIAASPQQQSEQQEQQSE